MPKSATKDITKDKVTRLTKTKRAALTFNVARTLRRMKLERMGRRISSASAVFMASVLEYMLNELAEVAINELHKDKVQSENRLNKTKNDIEIETKTKYIFCYPKVQPHPKKLSKKQKKNKEKY